MTAMPRVERALSRFPIAAATLYVAIIAAFVFIAAGNVLQFMEQRSAVAAARGILEQIEAHSTVRTQDATAADVSVPVGSPFLEGGTVSVAGAMLLQRVAAAATQQRGNILSSQVDLQGNQAKAGFVAVTSSLEVEPALLQPLLYDLEAGMPFLFVDQLVVQAPSGAATGAGGKLRVLLSVSAQWRGAK